MSMDSLIRFREIVDAIQDGYYEVDMRGTFKFVNPSFCRIMGQPREAILEKPYTMFTDEKTATAVLQAFRRVYRTGESIPSLESVVTHPNGEKRHVDISVTPFKDERGEISGFYGIVRDITDRYYEARHREAQLAETRRLYMQIKQLEEVKDFMLRLASREIRSPLTLITGYTDLLYDSLRDHFGKEEQTYYDSIQRAIQRMMQMTSDFLILEKMHNIFIEAKTPRQARVYIDDLARKAVMDFRREAVAKGLTLNLIVPDFPVAVCGEENDLSRAIANLLDNAIKYTPSGGAIVLKLVVAESEAVVSVEDTGIGVPQEKQDSLFTAFMRVPTSETQQVEGSGLGLYLVKKIVEWHGGRVFLHSVYREGSTFGFALPLVNQTTPAAI